MSGHLLNDTDIDLFADEVGYDLRNFFLQIIEGTKGNPAIRSQKRTQKFVYDYLIEKSVIVCSVLKRICFYVLT